MNDDKGFNPRSLTGATIAGIVNSDGWICFNPRSLTGATSPSPYVVPIAAFQSTLPHGSDLTLLLRSISLLHFNPRSLTGATWLVALGYQMSNISIHAPSRERPAALRPCCRRVHDFNPRSLTGATTSVAAETFEYDISIHAPSRERRAQLLTCLT